MTHRLPTIALLERQVQEPRSSQDQPSATVRPSWMQLSHCAWDAASVSPLRRRSVITWALYSTDSNVKFSRSEDCLLKFEQVFSVWMTASSSSSVQLIDAIWSTLTDAAHSRFFLLSTAADMLGKLPRLNFVQQCLCQPCIAGSERLFEAFVIRI